MMKKYLLLICATLITMSSTAQIVLKDQRLLLHKEALGKQVSQVKAFSKPDKRFATISSVMNDEPNGTLHSKDFRSGFYFANNTFMGVTSSDYENAIGQYVTTDDNIYIKNPFSTFPTNTWLKLDKFEGDTYVAHLPQIIYQPDSETTYYAFRLIVSQQKDGNGTYNVYIPDTTNANGSNAYFTYTDGVLTMNDKDMIQSAGVSVPKAIIGLATKDGQWYGFGDAAITITPNNLTPTSKPVSAVVEDYNYVLKNDVWEALDDSSTIIRSLVKVAFDGNDVYMNNPATKDSLSWIKGTFDGNKVTFLPQYIGPDYKDGIHLWFDPATYKMKLDTDYASWGYTFYIRDYSLTDSIVLNYDALSDVFTAPDSSSFLIAASPNRIYYLSNYDDAVLTPWSEEPATPSDPIITNVSETYQFYDYANMEFTIPSTDDKETLLNTDKIYYNVYTSKDTENPYQLTTENGYTKYTNNDKINIPYNYSDGTDITSEGDSKTWKMYFDTSNIDSLGVQSFYSGANELKHSKIVWYNLKRFHNSTGIDQMPNAHTGIISESYYDLSGRRIELPKNSGIYIRETIFSDGKKVATKFLKN